MTYGDTLREAEGQHTLEDDATDLLAYRASKTGQAARDQRERLLQQAAAGPAAAIASCFPAPTAAEYARRQADLDGRCRARGVRT